LLELILIYLANISVDFRYIWRYSERQTASLLLVELGIRLVLKEDTLLNITGASFSVCSYIQQWCHPVIRRLASERCYNGLQHKMERRREFHDNLRNQNSL